MKSSNRHTDPARRGGVLDNAGFLDNLTESEREEINNRARRDELRENAKSVFKIALDKIGSIFNNIKIFFIALTANRAERDSDRYREELLGLERRVLEQNRAYGPGSYLPALDRDTPGQEQGERMPTGGPGPSPSLRPTDRQQNAQGAPERGGRS